MFQKWLKVWKKKSMIKENLLQIILIYHLGCEWMSQTHVDVYF